MKPLLQIKISESANAYSSKETSISILSKLLAVKFFNDKELNFRQFVFRLFWFFSIVLSFNQSGGWLRICGRGIVWRKELDFSQRIGYKKYLKIGKYYVSFLQPM